MRLVYRAFPDPASPRFPKRSALLLALLCALPIGTKAETILHAGYDRAQDALVVEIAYRGSTPDHPFDIEWGECRTDAQGRRTTVARLIDTRGSEIAQNDYQVRVHFDLQAFQCRPAAVTLRLGTVSNATIEIPAGPTSR